jgi:GNAT superfamily N-acetyltransferase
MRLAALCDSPSAFVNTWAAEWEWRRERWHDCFIGRMWTVAQADGGVVGIGCLAPPDEGAPRANFIESVWVRPQYRQRGVLRHMVEHLEVLAAFAGATELRLWVLDTNERARTAYHKLGFSPRARHRADDDQAERKRDVRHGAPHVQAVAVAAVRSPTEYHCRRPRTSTASTVVPTARVRCVVCSHSTRSSAQAWR